MAWGAAVGAAQPTSMANAISSDSTENRFLAKFLDIFSSLTLLELGVVGKWDAKLETSLIWERLLFPQKVYLKQELQKWMK